MKIKKILENTLLALMLTNVLFWLTLSIVIIILATIAGDPLIPPDY